MHAIRCAVLLLCLVQVATASEPPVTAIAFAPDGESVVAGSQSGLAIYRWPELELTRSVDLSLANIHDLVFAPDGKRLAVAGGDPAVNGRVQVVAWPSCETIGVIGDHKDCVMKVAWRDDVSFATASLDREVVIWDTKSRDAIKRLSGHSRGVIALGFVGSSGNVLSGGLDNSLRVWDSDTGNVVRAFNNHTGPIQELAVRPSVEGLPMVATISDDSTVRLWQPTIGRMVRFVKLDSIPLAMGWLRSGSRLAIGCSDGHVRIVDPGTALVDVEIAVFADRVCSLAVHPTDDMIIVGSQQGRVQRVDLSE